jgi:CubicO group peptidase (beta-lactamase class C family)
VRHLLTHASGIELDDDSLYNAEAENARTLSRVVDAQVRALARHPEVLARAPGNYDYTNEGFDLAGAIVERAGGRPFHEFVAAEVFARAGMTSSGPLERDGAVPGLATGYTSRDGALAGNLPGPRRTNALWLSVYGRPSGQSYSTVDDLWRFVRELRGHRLLPAVLADAMLSPRIEASASGERRDDYGLGVEIRRRGPTIRFGHSGGLPGASSRVDVYPGLDYTVIVLANEDWTANNVADRIGEWIGAGFSVPPESAAF